MSFFATYASNLGGGGGGGGGGGTSTWKAPVANMAALPVVSNDPGDTRIVLSDSSIWTWNGSKWLRQLPYTPKKSLTLDGVSKTVSLGNNFAFDITTLVSVNFWIKLTNGTAAGIIVKEDGSTVGWEIYTAAGVIDFGFFGNGTSAYIVNSVALSTGVWYNIGFTYDGSQNANNIKMYVNGAPVAVTIGANTWAGSITTTAPCYLGSRNNTGSFLAAEIDELTFYMGTVLSPAQFVEIYNGGTPFDLATLSFVSAITAWYKIGDLPDNYTTLYDSVNLINGTGINLANTDFTADIA